MKDVESENAGLKAQLSQTQSRLAALSAIVQDLVDDDGMAKVNNRINELELRLGSVDMPTEQVKANVVPAIGDDLETRAVVAFTSKKGERTCPPGWKPFEAAKDRFVLGAGNKYQVVGKTGGTELVKLDERHMPSHDHFEFYTSDTTAGRSKKKAGYGIFRTIDGEGSHAGFAGRHEDGVMAPAKQLPRGGNEAHENMPPWIALYYCVKE